jgi:hypothetical protein
VSQLGLSLVRVLGTVFVLLTSCAGPASARADTWTGFSEWGTETLESAIPSVDEAVQTRILDTRQQYALGHGDVASTGYLLAARGAARFGDDAASVGRRAPDFVVTPRGEAIAVPTGASGPYPTRGPGFQYTGGAGGPGLDPAVVGDGF